MYAPLLERQRFLNFAFKKMSFSRSVLWVAINIRVRNLNCNMTKCTLFFLHF